MRTTDFSKAPPQGQAECMFVGATRYSGPLAIFTLQFTWFRMVRQMKKMPGFKWYKIYWEPPFTLGTIAMFDSRDSMMRFARGKHHRKLMQWITEGSKHGKGGYIRVYNAEEIGYANGIWRAEGDVMGHVPHFTPVTGEVLGPKVHKGSDEHLTAEQRAAGAADALESRLRAQGTHPEQTGVWKLDGGRTDGDSGDATGSGNADLTDTPVAPQLDTPARLHVVPPVDDAGPAEPTPAAPQVDTDDGVTDADEHDGGAPAP